MKARPSSTSPEIERTLELKRKAQRLQQDNLALRETLRSVRQELRQERARARTVSRVLNPHLLHGNETLTVAQRELKGVALNFLRAELLLSQTFLAIALHASDPEKRRRNVRNARLAYESLKRFSGKSLMTKEEAKRLEKGIANLKDELVRAGEKF